MPVIRDPAAISERRGTIYPAPFKSGFEGRSKRALGNACGLTQFGVNLTTLQPGAVSALRHWHTSEDEFIYVLDGELTLELDGKVEILVAGMAAGFPAGEPVAHRLANHSDAPATYLEVGTRAPQDEVVYPHDDLLASRQSGQTSFRRKTGEPYE
jgi:uncharacterized cupin superfamily protein